MSILQLLLNIINICVVFIKAEYNLYILPLLYNNMFSPFNTEFMFLLQSLSNILECSSPPSITQFKPFRAIFSSLLYFILPTKYYLSYRSKVALDLKSTKTYKVFLFFNI